MMQGQPHIRFTCLSDVLRRVYMSVELWAWRKKVMWILRYKMTDERQRRRVSCFRIKDRRVSTSWNASINWNLFLRLIIYWTTVTASVTQDNTCQRCFHGRDDYKVDSVVLISSSGFKSNITYSIVYSNGSLILLQLHHFTHTHTHTHTFVCCIQLLR